MGNETGLGRSFDAMYAAMKKIDPTRPIHYESRNPPYAPTLSSFDIISTMYPTVEHVLDLMKQDETRPVIICEYAHSMGNGLGNFDKYWDAFDAHPRLQGGFTWDWVDQALRHPGPGGRAAWDWVNTSDGANGNDGLVNADRTPQPELQEAKKVQQPVKVEAADAAAGRVRVRNAYDFVDLSGLALEWKLLADGVPVQSGTWAESLDVRPGESRELALPVDPAKLRGGAAGILELSFKTREEQDWVARGHEVAWAQVALPGPDGLIGAAISQPPPALDVKASGTRVVLSSAVFEAAFENGGLVSYRLAGEEQLAAPMVPHLWRVPTDNDEGGGAASFAHRWRQAGLDSLQVVSQPPRVERVGGDGVRVVIESRLTGKSAAVDLKTVYDVDGSGAIRVAALFDAAGKLPPLPRVGFQLQLPGTHDSAEWYGPGPHESYADRKRGARIGRYRSKVADLHFPHVMAQENGNRTDVRWLTLVDARGRGLRVSGEGATLDFTAHDYTDAALLAAKTSQVIEKDGRVTLSLDLAQMGLGGDDSWTPRVHPEFQLTAPQYRFGFRLEPASN
jgi:beta-galactosidase